MFELRDFIINTIKSMLGNEAEYKVRKYASGWFEKDVLTLEDLQMIDDYYKPVIESTEGESYTDASTLIAGV